MASLNEGEWSCYGGCQSRREKGHVRGSEVVSLLEGEQSCYRGGQFKEGRMVVIEVASLMEGTGHVKELANLMEGEWLCYKGGLFNGGGSC